MSETAVEKRISGREIHVGREGLPVERSPGWAKVSVAESGEREGNETRW